MINLLKRNLILYFNNKANVFFSLLASLISFGLFILFIKNNLQNQWHAIAIYPGLLDNWIIGGTLTTTAISSSLTALTRYVIDKSNNVIADISLTDLSFKTLQISYIVSAVIVSTIMQLFTFTFMSTYFSLVDKIDFQWNVIPMVILMAILDSFVWTAFGFIITSLINNQDALSGCYSIINTLAGFFALVYFPLMTLPKLGQLVIKLTPAPYMSAMYRNILMQNDFKNAFRNSTEHSMNIFKNQININIGNVNSLNSQILVLLTFILIFTFIFLIVSLKTRKNLIH
ncbi:ABC transporter permease [Apilactobacillus xinyiensis]|uniref:ABC transporter permease n=1 Tax=Apilactobacillus xinyiensis TaxID=2841032 RepID=UPI00200D3B3F|nr:ABC transporter permease [Apilactobacillus xinyiensis]MCL0330226.1 ABC transporter permease [Apilactobacillus xinyiensis]